MSDSTPHPAVGNDATPREEVANESAPQWDADNLRTPKRPKPERKVVTIQVGSNVLEVTRTGECRTCGDKIVYAHKHDIWFHVPFFKGEKKYDHQGRPR